MARTRFPHTVEYEVGPFIGVSDTKEPAAQKPEMATAATNVVSAPNGAPGLIGRPGFTRASATQMTGSVQGAFVYTLNADNLVNFIVHGGKLYALSPLSTLTDVTPVGVTIDANATNVYGVQFDDSMIVTDGVNRPWRMTNISSNPVTGTYLTGVPGVVYGPPVVYYAKVFFIKNDERDTIIWSEELDAHTGYEAGGYNNSWTLAQTSQEPLEALAATNESLYYFRRTSIGAITGAVNDDFVNAGVHDSVSLTSGITAIPTLTRIGTDYYFLDQNGVPQVLRDRRLLSLADGVGETLRGTASGGSRISTQYQAGFNRDLGVWLCMHPDVGGGTVLVYHVESQQWLGTWSVPPTAPVFSRAKDSATRDLLLVIGGGYVYYQKLAADDDQFDRTDGSTATAVAHSVTTPWIGHSPSVQQHFNRVDVTARASGTVSSYQYAWVTPSGSNSGTLSMPAGTSGRIVKGSVGTNAFGRGMQLTISHSSSTTKFALDRVMVYGTALTDSPDVV